MTAHDVSLDTDLHVGTGVRGSVIGFLESTRFQIAMTGIILVNAAILGLDALPAIRDDFGNILDLADRGIIALFVIELAVKIAVNRLRFFTNGWNLFDFAVVAIALVPASGAFSVLRALRAFRLFRLISILPKARMTVEAMISSLGGLATSTAMLALVLYIFVVLANALFRDSDPELFGSLGRSLYSLYEVMIFFGADSEVVLPVSEHHAWAWLFFAPFVLSTSFALLNLFIGVISGEVQEQHDKAKKLGAGDDVSDDDPATHGEVKVLQEEIRTLTLEIRDLHRQLSVGTRMPQAGD
jgi:voltage-gated sodium channel